MLGYFINLNAGLRLLGHFSGLFPESWVVFVQPSCWVTGWASHGEVDYRFNSRIYPYTVLNQRRCWVICQSLSFVFFFPLLKNLRAFWGEKLQERFVYTFAPT